MPSYLPPAPYVQPGYDPATGRNTGDLGFMTLPIERTVGGFENNIWNPNANPYPGGFTQDDEAAGLDPRFNPFTQGYMRGDEWLPYLPGKIVIGQRQPTQPFSKGATQFIDGKEYNIGGVAGPRVGAAPRPFEVGPGDERQEQAAPMTGFHFGQVGQPGYRFMGGAGQDGKFYSDQPGLNPAPDRTLGTFKPWNPAAAALQSYRSQP